MCAEKWLHKLWIGDAALEIHERCSKRRERVAQIDYSSAYKEGLI